MNQTTNIESLVFSGKKVSPSTILEGLGELISDENKDRIKATLIRDLLFDLRSRI